MRLIMQLGGSPLKGMRNLHQRQFRNLQARLQELGVSESDGIGVT